MSLLISLYEIGSTAKRFRENLCECHICTTNKTNWGRGGRGACWVKQRAESPGHAPQSQGMRRYERVHLLLVVLAEEQFNITTQCHCLAATTIFSRFSTNLLVPLPTLEGSAEGLEIYECRRAWDCYDGSTSGVTKMSAPNNDTIVASCNSRTVLRMWRVPVSRYQACMDYNCFLGTYWLYFVYIYY